MWRIILPLAMVVISNTFYHIISKKTPTDANALLSLSVTYAASAIFSFVIFIIGSHGASLTAEMKKLNWTSLALGIVIVGLELGWILAYRAGADVSRAPLIANCTLAVVLVFVGALLFRETITIKQIIGMIVCIIGMIIVSI